MLLNCHLSIRFLTLAFLLMFLIGGCASGSTAIHDADPGDEAVPVLGTARCSKSTVSEEMGDGVVTIEEQFSCATELSDSRVSGTQTLPIVIRMLGMDGTWTVSGAVLSTEEGRWTGSGRGVATFSELEMPAETLAPPLNFGEMHYSGEGPYEGLEFHYYIMGSNTALAIAGWIDEAPSE